MRKGMEQAREKWYNEQYEITHSRFPKGNSKIAFHILRKLTKSKHPRLIVIEDKNESLLTEK